MRQILVLGLLAAIGWWIYDGWFVTPAQAGPGGSGVVASGGNGNGNGNGNGGGGGQAPAPSLRDLVGSGSGTGNGNGGGQAAPAEPAPNAARAALDADGQKALDELSNRIQQNDAAAIAQGWVAINSRRLQAGVERRILDALRTGLSNETDFRTAFARLGSHNTFLHHAEGRQLGDLAFAAAMRLPDADAVAAGTRYLDLCLRGHIKKGDAAARAAVDRAFATYRVRADRWLCDPQNVAGARSYTVKSGDSLNRIARRFRREGVLVDEGTIAALNRIHNKNAIQVGQRLKVPADPIHCVVEKRSFSLGVYVGANLLRLYWVGLGANDKTPVTTFEVIEKQPRPEWTAPDGRVLPYGHHENILGEYFVKFRHPSYTGFGAHGTPMPETICTMSSMGCIRMYAPDIAELFDILPRGATVEIRASEAP
ncbi:MAG: L,D-transpeptidase family protein [bacterium]|nr:L,D-transpeptidase family protein [bacterium]